MYFWTRVFLRCFQSRFSAGVALRLRSRALRVVEGWIRLSFDPPSNSLPRREGGFDAPRRPRGDVMAGGTWTATGFPAESVRTCTTRGALSGFIPRDLVIFFVCSGRAFALGRRASILLVWDRACRDRTWVPLSTLLVWDRACRGRTWVPLSTLPRAQRAPASV